MTRGLVSIQGWSLQTGKITKKDKHRTATEWPRPGLLTQVTNIILRRLYERKVGTSKTGRFIVGSCVTHGRYVQVRPRVINALPYGF